MPKKLAKKIEEKTINMDKLAERLDKLDKKQTKILKLQNTLLKKEEEILKLEEKIYDSEKKSRKYYKNLDEKKLKTLFERKPKKLGKITYKDITKAIIGAFFGIMGHFAFAKGIDIAQEHTIMRSSLLLITSFFILILFLYYSGFRDIKPQFFLKIIPVRAAVIYVAAIFTVIFVLFLYGIINFNTPINIAYNYIAAVSILAVLGAGTSDLIGND